MLVKLANSSDRYTEQVLAMIYDELAVEVSSNSLRALLALQKAGAFQEPQQIAKEAQKLATKQEPDGKPFESDISYRLRYLCLFGLVGRGASDYALTSFGAAYIKRARSDRLRYSKVFPDS